MIRFGIYEADLEAGELRKGGRIIKLQEKPFQILAILLKRPGQIVTRQELKDRLWPGDTYIDFDHGLNTAVGKLRQALGDSAENPRFIETIPRRGYSFFAPILWENAPPGHSYEDPSTAGLKEGRRHRKLLLAAPFALALVGAVVFVVFTRLALAWAVTVTVPVLAK